jgi:peroxiredoxin
LLCDETRTVSEIYGANAAADTQYPARISYLIDTQGRIEKVYARVDLAGHPDQVLQDIGGPPAQIG